MEKSNEERATVAVMRAWLRNEFFTNKAAALDQTIEAAMRLHASRKADWAAEALFHLDQADGKVLAGQQEHYEALRREFHAQQEKEEL